MIKHKNKILVLGCLGILIATFGAWHTAKAADVSIYVEPAQVNKKVGDSFVIAVKIDPNGQKVCAVESKLNLNKLSCQKITMGSGISPQLYPSCDNLNFLLGIQGCATSKKTLFTVTVKAENTGAGTANFTEVDIIGEGVPLSFVASVGAYEITAIPQAITPSCQCGNWGYWQNSACGEDTCLATQRFQSQTRTCIPSACNIEIRNRCIDDNNCIATLESEENNIADVETVTGEFLETEQETTSAKENAEDTLSKEVSGDIFLADIGVSWWDKITESTSSTIVIILGFIVLVAIGATTWWTRRKKKVNIVKTKNSH